MYFTTFFLVSAFVCGTFAQDTPLVAPEIKLADNSKVEQVDINFAGSILNDIVRGINMVEDRLNEADQKKIEALKKTVQKDLTTDAQGNTLPLTISTYDDYLAWLQAAEAATNAVINVFSNFLTDIEGTNNRDDRRLIFEKRNDYILIFLRIRILRLITTYKYTGSLGPLGGMFQTLLGQIGGGGGSNLIGVIMNLFQNSNMGSIIEEIMRLVQGSNMGGNIGGILNLFQGSNSGSNFGFPNFSNITEPRR